MTIALIAALTADGYIGQSATHRSTNWSSREDLQFFVAKTKEYGVCVMGSTTFATIGKPLKDRVLYVYTSQPEKVAGMGESVRATSSSPAELVAELTAGGHDKLIICGGTRVYTQWMESGLVNKLYLTIEPLIFGSGIRLFDRPLAQALHLDSSHQLSSQTVMLEFSVPTVSSAAMA